MNDYKEETHTVYCNCLSKLKHNFLIRQAILFIKDDFTERLQKAPTIQIQLTPLNYLDFACKKPHFTIIFLVLRIRFIGSLKVFQCLSLNM